MSFPVSTASLFAEIYEKGYFRGLCAFRLKFAKALISPKKYLVISSGLKEGDTVIGGSKPDNLLSFVVKENPIFQQYVCSSTWINGMII